MTLFFYLFNVIVNECDRSCNINDDPNVQNEIMMNVGLKVRNQMIGVLAKMTIYGILRMIVNAIRHVKLMNI